MVFRWMDFGFSGVGFTGSGFWIGLVGLDFFLRIGFGFLLDLDVVIVQLRTLASH